MLHTWMPLLEKGWNSRSWQQEEEKETDTACMGRSLLLPAKPRPGWHEQTRRQRALEQRLSYWCQGLSSKESDSGIELERRRNFSVDDLPGCIYTHTHILFVTLSDWRRLFTEDGTHVQDLMRPDQGEAHGSL